MADVSNHESSTIEWYVARLHEEHPEWTNEQCVELATGFTLQQRPPAPKAEPEEETEEQTAEQARNEERKTRRNLNTKELADILSVPISKDTTLQLPVTGKR